MVVVGKDFILIGQVCVVVIDQIDVGQFVFFGDFLCVQVFFDGYWVIGVVFDCCVIGYDYYILFYYVIDVCDYVCRRGCVVIYVMCCCCVDFQKWCVGIQQVCYLVVWCYFVV